MDKRIILFNSVNESDITLTIRLAIDNLVQGDNFFYSLWNRTIPLLNDYDYTVVVAYMAETRNREALEWLLWSSDLLQYSSNERRQTVRDHALLDQS